jgi:atypical dual specificity phosphatase
LDECAFLQITRQQPPCFRFSPAANPSHTFIQLRLSTVCGSLIVFATTFTMSRPQEGSLLWWVIPKVLAGMPMPFIHLDRRMAGGGALAAFDDELPILYSAGVRAVVSLLNIPSDASVYESAGFSFRCLPVPDGRGPTIEQAEEFTRFVTDQRVAHRPVAVHCEAGLGRTGTLLAAYLLSEGKSAAAAIEQVRAVEGVAVETVSQIQFLQQYAARHHTHDG